jgi:integrase
LVDLARKRERERLPKRRDPYWQRLAEGAYLGYRTLSDTWRVRYRGRDGKQQFLTLGEGLEFDEAKRSAEEWLGQLSGSPVRTVKRTTVRAALEAYLADLRRHDRLDAAADAERRFKKTVYGDPPKLAADPVAELELERCTRDDFLEWRDRQREGREARSVNRHVRSVVAALNRAVELGHMGNPLAWKFKALPDDTEDSGETAILLDERQRKALIGATTPYAAAFIRGIELTGARPHEMAAVVVADFNGEILRLAHRKGKPPKLRVRHTVLGADGIEFFKQQVAGKLPQASIFTEDGVTAWRRHMWCRQIREAIAAHNRGAKPKDHIPVEASAYSFRHARISELLQLHGVDPLTVAAQTGTSLAMIEKAYFKFIPNALREKLAAVKELKS